MKNKARDGRLFNSLEQSAYNNGYYIGKSRKDVGEFMGSSHTSGFRGRNRLIFNEGLEDGYSGVVWNNKGECIQIGVWKSFDLVDWKGIGARIISLWPPGTFHNNKISLASISNANMKDKVSFCSILNQDVPVYELKEYTDKSK